MYMRASTSDKLLVNVDRIEPLFLKMTFICRNTLLVAAAAADTHATCLNTYVR